MLDGPELLRAGLGRLPPAAIIVRGYWMYPLLLLLDGTGGRGMLAGAGGRGMLAVMDGALEIIPILIMSLLAA